MLVVALPLFLLAIPLDGTINELRRAFTIGGDIRRELSTWQQFGAIGSLVFVVAVFASAIPARARRMWDVVVACLIVAAACALLKMLFGRARPDIGLGVSDPGLLFGVSGLIPVEHDGVWRLVPAWRAGYPTASFPSSHTAAAAALAVGLRHVEPRLGWLVPVMVGIVGCARVLLGAHWASDVIAGSAVGLILAEAAMRGRWGERLRVLLGGRSGDSRRTIAP